MCICSIVFIVVVTLNAIIACVLQVEWILRGGSVAYIAWLAGAPRSTSRRQLWVAPSVLQLWHCCMYTLIYTILSTAERLHLVESALKQNRHIKNCHFNLSTMILINTTARVSAFNKGKWKGHKMHLQILWTYYYVHRRQNWRTPLAPGRALGGPDTGDGETISSSLKTQRYL